MISLAEQHRLAKMFIRKLGPSAQVNQNQSDTVHYLRCCGVSQAAAEVQAMTPVQFSAFIDAAFEEVKIPEHILRQQQSLYNVLGDFHDDHFN